MTAQKTILVKICRWLKHIYSTNSYTARKLFMKTAIPAAFDRHLVYSTKSSPFTSYGFYDGNLDISNAFNKFSSYEQTDYIYNLKYKALLEPLFGFVVTENDEYFRESIPYSNDFTTPAPFVFSKSLDRNKICLNEAISIRYGWNNYWHFYNDAIGTLIFLHSHGVSKDIPIVIPEKALQNHYVREVLKDHEYFKKLNFVFQQRNQWIECNNIWFGKVLPNTRDNLLRVGDLIDSCELSDSLKNEKIFVTRRGSTSRNLSNIDNIERIAKAHGFSVVDTTRLDVVVQKAKFISAKVIIGVHGAALSNLIFANVSKPKVLEIFPGNSIPPHYYWLSREFGYEYRAILGSSLNSDGEFTLDEKMFLAEIMKL